jgi:hypothetical protein
MMERDQDLVGKPPRVTRCTAAMVVGITHPNIRSLLPRHIGEVVAFQKWNGNHFKISSPGRKPP